MPTQSLTISSQAAVRRSAPLSACRSFTFWQRNSPWELNFRIVQLARSLEGGGTGKTRVKNCHGQLRA